ncbi:MAG: ubiquinol oxidase subunit II [Acidisphaera sp.]|nr:ubiquinol oxidase subunit II [Acidisphaera sp.]
MPSTKDDMTNHPPPLRPLYRLAQAAAVQVLLLLSACQPAVLDPHGFVGRSERTILIDSLAIMLAIVIPTVCATLGFAWWFRASNSRAKYLPDWAYSGEIELVVWGIPLLTILLLGGVAWLSSHELDPANPVPSNAKPIEIQGVSLDWKWLFIYPDQHVASVNQLVVPAGVPLHFRLTSASVLNVFFVPQLGSMIYTMNGMTSTLNLIADDPGTFLGRSAHYSGDGFSDMHFEVRAVPADQFAAWVTSTRGTGQALDAGSYAQLARQSTNVAPSTYRDADPSLFGKIVSQQIPPAPGPQVGLPSVDVSNRTEQ